MTNINGCIFDLDGVLVDTARYHYQAWRKLANELGFDFSEADNEQLKGVGRMESLDIILGLGGKILSEKEKEQWASKKNEWYIDLISHLDDKELLPGTLEFLKTLQKASIKIALGSASKNALPVLKSTNILSYFDAVIDGTQTTKGKPDPQVFQMGAKALQLSPNTCVVFEDAQKGVQAAKAGGFNCVGIGDKQTLSQADFVVDGLDQMTLEKLQEWYATAV